MEILYWKNTLPSDWAVMPLKAVATYKVSSVDKVIKEDEESVSLCNYTDVYKNDFITNDLDFMQGSATEDEIEKYRLEVGDVLITKDSETWDDIAIPALVKETKDNLLCGYHLAIIKPDRKKLFPDFLFRCLQSKEIRVQMELASTGVTRYGLPKDEIGRASLPIPDIKTQKLISGYIEKETKEIDKLIKAKEIQLQLLSEKRKSLLTQVVTKGINANVKFKDSGINWLGMIPIHWDLKRLKYITSKIGSGVTPKGGATVYTKEGIPLLRSQNIHFSGLKLDDVVFISEEIHESMENSKVFEGDVLINITGASIGRCFYYNGELGEANVNQHVCILRPNQMVKTEYLYLLLSSNIGQNQVWLNQVGGGREGLTFESIKTFIFPLPDLVEQNQIIEQAKIYDENIRNLEMLTEQSLNLLKERRSTIISSAVTGQLKIQS